MKDYSEILERLSSLETTLECMGRDNEKRYKKLSSEVDFLIFLACFVITTIALGVW